MVQDVEGEAGRGRAPQAPWLLLTSLVFLVGRMAVTEETREDEGRGRTQLVCILALPCRDKSGHGPTS